jgi:hypothetical protein
MITESSLEGSEELEVTLIDFNVSKRFRDNDTCER